MFSRNVNIVERCMLDKKIYQRPIAYKFLWQVFDKEERKYILVNGKKRWAWYFIRKGDIIDTIKRPSGGWLGSAFQVIVGAILVYTGIGTPLGYGLLLSGVAGAAGLFLSRGSGLTTTSQQDATNSQPDITGASNTTSTSIIPVTWGEIKQTPYYAQSPFKLIEDGTAKNVYCQYFISNYRNALFSQEKIGETNISDFQSNYLTINHSFGGSSYIGYSNIKPIQKDEQLVISEEGLVYDDSIIYYWVWLGKTISVVFTAQVILEFTNVDIANWGNKTFKVASQILNSGDYYSFSSNITVTTSDLTLVSGNTYRATISTSYTVPAGGSAFRVEYIQVIPISATRITEQEKSNELNVHIVQENFLIDSSLIKNYSLYTQIANYVTGTYSEVIETSPSDTVDIDIIVKFPQGLYKQNTDGSRSARSQSITVRYKDQNTATYSSISSASAIYVRDSSGNKVGLGTTTVSGEIVTFQPPADITQADELFYRTIGFTVPKNKYTISIKPSATTTKTNYDIGYPVIDMINFYVDSPAIDTDILPSVNQTSIMATAYANLSGTLKQYNYITQTTIPIWNGSDWNDERVSNNPAAVIRYFLTSPLINPRAESLSVIDNDSLVELYEWCEYKGFETNGLVYDYIKIYDILTAILSSCMASFTIYNGKYFFVIDDDRKPIIEEITQHNSWNFTWIPSIGRVTDALRVSFTNEDTWTNDELTLYYDDGEVSETPASGKDDEDYYIIKEDINYVTNRDIILANTEYKLRVLQEKRQEFEFYVNLESLYLKIYDRIMIANSCNMYNASSGLIKEVITNGNKLIGFKLYDNIDIADGSKITIRSLDFINETSSISSYTVKNYGYTNIVYIAEVVYNGNIRGKGTIQGIAETWEYDGDLFHIGQETPTICIVTGVKYNEDMTAKITARIQ